MKLPLQRFGVLLAVAAALLCTGAGYLIVHGKAQDGDADVLALLLPDGTDQHQPAVRQWLDAAEEEGLHLRVLYDSDLLNPALNADYAGIVLPDQLHRVANDSLIGALYSFVQNGGKLMVVHDAAILDLKGVYVGAGSRLSVLTGVKYALYDRYATGMIHRGAVWGTESALKELGIPPGKAIPVAPDLKYTALDTASPNSGGNQRLVLSRYQYGELEYSCFRTEGAYTGTVLLQSEACLAAGYRTEGKGGVLFVNLPLGYLASRTDGLLMHSFLRYFASSILRLPVFSSVPDGVGGLVMNWHIDARSALKPMAELERAGIFARGPFSVHITAGPDVDTFNDGKGLDVAHNHEIQRWMRRFAERGYAIGDHGGWIHNYFGEHVADNNEAEFQQYLQLNYDTLQKVLGRPAQEYSSPVGNHPQWVSRWLEQRGFIAYYFTGDSGMGPTQVYRDGKRDGASIWAFPILHLGRQASLEEMNFDSVPESTVREWLLAIADFVASQHTARLVYSHPLGATRYIPTLEAWFQRTDSLSRAGQFRWYTMTQLAQFLNRRKLVEWGLSARSKGVVLAAKDKTSLRQMTWSFPQSRFERPRITTGSATVREAGGLWLVTAGDCRTLKITAGER